MSLNKRNTRTFHRMVYAGQLKTLILLKRNYDQQEGTVTAIKLFQCMRFGLQKSGQPIQRNWSVGSKTRWMVPYSELKRVGITELCVDDRLVETADQTKEVRYWQPEGEQQIDISMYENYHLLDTIRVDPPLGN